jgi:hypothetical protein
MVGFLCQCKRMSLKKEILQSWEQVKAWTFGIFKALLALGHTRVLNQVRITFLTSPRFSAEMKVFHDWAPDFG